MQKRLLCLFAACVVYVAGSCDVMLTDNLSETVSSDGGTDEKETVFCIDTQQDDITMLVVFEKSSSSASSVQINDNPNACESCSECVSIKDEKCQSDTSCACNMHCLQGICSQTIAPLTPGRWYIRVRSTPGYTIRARLFPAWELEEGVTHESSLASVEPFIEGQRVVEASPWWDYYYLVPKEDGTLTVSVRNLEDSGIFRGYVKVVMQTDTWPDQQHNSAVYSTYTRDTVEAHLKNVQKDKIVYIGVLGMGNERWIRYNIKTGGYRFALAYAILGVLSLVVLLGIFVWYYKKRMQGVQPRQRPFHSKVFDDGM